jgi:hypothetical protein
MRNHFIASIADAILITYAAPGGKLEELFKESLAFKKPILVLKNEYNHNLLSKTGIRLVNPNTIGQELVENL